jgi:hypothetical protein
MGRGINNEEGKKPKSREIVQRGRKNQRRRKKNGGGERTKNE